LRGDNIYSNPNLALLLVTHDRHFLDLVCNEIMELDKGAIHFYPGSYTKFIELRRDRIAAKAAEIERAKTELKKEKEWMGRQPQGRQAKSKARMDNFYELEKLAKQKVSDGTKLELIAAGDNRRLGGVVVNLDNVSYSLPGDSNRVMLRDFSYNFDRDDRIGVVGPNGVGKSTFLKILTGLLAPDSGKVEIGETVTFGFYNQMGIILSDKEKEMTVIKFIQESFDKSSGHDDASSSSESLAFSETEAMSLLTRFQFPNSRWFEPMGALSGGEKRRLQLLQILAKKPNVLVLDEPSNDLDLSTLQVLEDYLVNSFTGTVICVSHDRMFMDNVPEHLFVFDGNGVVRNFKGKYSDYLDSLHRKM
jgi:ATP-binding cassette subfamily F protein uup